MKKVCIFIDGENLRHSICDLFVNFKSHDYLPKNADWTGFFNWIARESAGAESERVRAYWYVVKDIDFTPYGLAALREDPSTLESVLSREPETKQRISVIKEQSAKITLLQNLVDLYEEKKKKMEKRFTGWINIQNGISGKHVAVEFRRAGSIRYDLFENKLGSEKAVDVNLAVDLVRLRDIYDVAVIVSGDQDYVPAVSAIKDYGKRVVSVAFQKEDGTLLPGGARRLEHVTDTSLKIRYQTLKDYLFPQDFTLLERM